MAKMREVRTIFTLDKVKFEQDLKGLDKVVDSFEAGFKGTNKEIDTMTRNLKSMRQELEKNVKSLKDMGQSSKEFETMVKNLAKVESNLKGVKSQLSGVQNEARQTGAQFKKMTELDLTSINKLQSTIEKIKNTKIDLAGQFQGALDIVKQIQDKAGNVKFGIDMTSVQGALSSISSQLANFAKVRIAASLDSSGFENSQKSMVNRSAANTVTGMGGANNAGTIASAANTGAIAVLIAKITGLTNAINKNNEANDGNTGTLNTLGKLMMGETGNIDAISRRLEGVLEETNKHLIRGIAALQVSEGGRRKSVNGLDHVSNMNERGDLSSALDRITNNQGDAKELAKDVKIATKAMDELGASARLTGNIIDHGVNQDIDDLANKILKANNRLNDLNHDARNTHVDTNRLNNSGPAGGDLPNIPGQPGRAGGRLGGPGYLQMFSSSGGSGGMMGLMGRIGGGAGGAGAGGAAGGAAGLSAGLLAVASAAAIAAAAIAVYAAGLSVALGAMKKAVDAASEFDAAIGKFSATTNSSAEDVKKFQDTIVAGFGKQGFTADVQAYGDALTYVQRSLKLAGDEAEAMTKKVLGVSQATGYDINEITGAQKNLMANLGVDAGRALDMIMGLYKETGDLKQEALDTFTEYSAQLQKTGISAEYFYAALVKGSQAGVMNMDKVADSLKEVQLRLADPTDQKMLEALNKLGLSYKSLTSDMANGKAEEALQSIFDKINTSFTDASGKVDEMAKQNVIQALFGSPGEDVGNQFFTFMADAKKTVDDFGGSVDKTNAALENTWNYQMQQLNNSFKSLWGYAGEQVLPYLTDLIKGMNGEMGTLEKAVRENVAPAFLELAQAIAYALGLDKPNDFANGLVDIINWFGKMINVIADVTVAISQIGDVLRMVWNVVQIVFKSVDTLIKSISNGLIYVIEGAMRSVVEGFQWAMNQAIDLYNNTAAKIPGVGKIDKYKVDFGGAWSKDNGSLKTLTSDWNSGWASVGGDINDIIDAAKHLADGFKMYGSNNTRSNIKPTSTTPPKTPPQITPPKAGNNNGTNQTDKDKAAADKAAAEAEKARLEAIKKEQDYWKMMFDLAKQGQADIIAIETGQAQIRWDLMGAGTDAALKDQYDFYDNIKKKYILTLDEMQAYNQKQRDIVVQMDANALKKTKDNLDKELKLYTDANDAKIKDNERFIKNIDRQLAKNEQDNFNTDLSKEITDLQAERDKYVKATSYEGIKKYQELDKQLKDKLLEQERENTKQKLEAQKQGLEDQNTELQDKNDEATKKYQNMYDELDKLVGNREGLIAKARELAVSEANDNIKKSLEELAKSYEDNYARIQATLMSNEQIQNTIIEQAKRDYEEAKKTGDTAGMEAATQKANLARSRGGTLGAGQDTVSWLDAGSADYQVFEANQKRWGELQAEKVKNGDTDGTIKAQQDKLNAANNALRKKYGVGPNDDIPKFSYKYHTGGVAGGAADVLGEISAKLLPGEVTLTNQRFNQLMNFLDRFVPSTMGLSAAYAPASSGTSNNSNVNFTIQNYSPKDNADIQKISSGLREISVTRDRANGNRRL